MQFSCKVIVFIIRVRDAHCISLSAQYLAGFLSYNLFYFCSILFCGSGVIISITCRKVGLEKIVRCRLLSNL